jgi:hypothetical protein
MADYYPLIARAVAGLEKNTGEARRALYERARQALVAQLRGVSPALGESDITRERLGLEESIRKVEAEAARRSRMPEAGEPAKPDSRPAETPALEFPRPDPPRGDGARADAPRSEGPPSEGLRGEGPRGDTPRPFSPPERSRNDITRAASTSGPAAATMPMRGRGSRPSMSSEGLKGFRDVVAEADDLGAATAQASKSAREAFAAVPSPPGSEFERIEPHIEPDGLRPRDPLASAPDVGFPSSRRESRASSPPPPPPLPESSADHDDEHDDYAPTMPPYRGAGQWSWIVVPIAVVLILAGLGYWQRGRIVSLFQALRGQPAAVTREVAPAQPKITDRIGPGGPEQRPNAPAGQPGAAVAQRVVLYEEDPNDPQGKRFVGSTIWRTETVSPGPGLAPELVVRADVDIPERHINMTWSLRRNTDKALPASHTVEVMFNLPADFPGGGIQFVPGILMKQDEQSRGQPLAGQAVKVTNNFFLIGLSSVDDQMQRNIQLLKERSWFDVPIVYTNGRRAILAMEKGTPGERVFNEAFAAWGK